MSGKTALVTGAARGLGKGTCEALLRAGYSVIAAGRGDNVDDAVSELSANLGGAGSIRAVRVDVASDESVEALARELKGERVDVLVNNAGVILEDPSGDATSVPAEVVERTININALGAYRLTQVFLPGMNERGWGRVVNVSSGMGSLSGMGAGHPAYRISKAAMNAITIAGSHAAAKGVLVNSICPGWVRTDMGGAGASRSVPEGVASIMAAVEFADDGPSGGFFRDGKRVEW